MVSEMKSCPFCGSTASLLVSNPGDDARWVAVYCAFCDAWGPSVQRAKVANGAVVEEVAWRAWNTRFGGTA